jgi:hypothetical protein
MGVIFVFRVITPGIENTKVALVKIEKSEGSNSTQTSQK